MITEGIHDPNKVAKCCDTPTTTTNTPAEKFTTGIQNSITDTSTNDVTFPEGAYYVSIRPLVYNAPIIINGEEYYVTEEYNREERVNRVLCIQDFVPKVVITANGNAYDVTIAYPSNHTVDLQTIGL